MSHWADHAVFYHLYPLGLCNAPHRNDLAGPPLHRLEKLGPWFEQARALGATAVLLGPIMESGSHGYDVIDYLRVDRRLGDEDDLVRMAAAVKNIGLKLVLDGVFNHVGRGFPAFRDVLARGRESSFIDWFHLDFTKQSPLNDPFSYQAWNGCFDLVKLNLDNPQVRSKLFEAVTVWIRQYDIDGLRLDVADRLDFSFMRDLGVLCRQLKPDFWLMGEVVKGPYDPWLEKAGLDAVTNYEGYKGLYSSHNDENYFEIAYTLRRQFGEDGLYSPTGLFTFADNHDVSRVASRLKNRAHLFPLYVLVFTMPGIPSIYYGSEFGVEGDKGKAGDWPLRPALDLVQLRSGNGQGDLIAAITRLSRLRAELPALQKGDFQELALEHRRIVFSRRTPGQWVIVAVSAEKEPVEMELTLDEKFDGRLVDRLNPGQEFEIKEGKVGPLTLWPCWARVMEVRR